MKVFFILALSFIFSNSVFAETKVSIVEDAQYSENLSLAIKSLTRVPLKVPTSYGKKDFKFSKRKQLSLSPDKVNGLIKKHDFLSKKSTMKLGAGSSGGGQGIVDTSGKLHFVDILSPVEINNLKIQSAKDVDIISDVKCTNEMYTPSERSQFKYEMDEARKLLVAAGKILIPENPKYFPEGDVLHMVPLTHYFITSTFRVTAFKLSQIYDATQVAADTQIQLAIYNYGITYFQKQALLSLKNKARAVFIKEALRNTNFHEELGLDNSALEKATYFIFHGEIENFNNSEFAKKFRSEKVMYFTGITDSEFSFFGVKSMMIGLKLTRYPEMFDYVTKATSKFAPGYPTTIDRVAPADMLWSTTTGELIEQRDCQAVD
ncbi:hypothetical protein A9Q84_10180 [Halobacteriovorax marinus]|uniref:Uncharacterized protein n=1 Tax=Halobacteriovorax marinus TaxID=97084 RepID=A0A1Y5FB61_9BACT|nr:hypothetical protein A9Q84_10180 [Halobacteriovorax marinus]